MSTVQRVNFEPITDMIALQKKHLKLLDPSLLNPHASLHLVDGEWMKLSSDGKAMERACDVASAGNAGGASLAYPMWHERGRSDGLALGNRGAPILFNGSYEADTRIFDAAATVGSGAAVTTVGQPLKVASIDLGGKIYSGLVGHGGEGTDTDRVVGYVTRLPADNGGKLRFRGGNLF